MITHDYFGKLDLDGDVLWEKQMHIAEVPEPVMVDIWLDGDPDELLTPAILDKCAKLCQSLDDLHQQSKQHLLDDLLEDDTYMQLHLDNINELDMPELQALIENNACTPDNFVKLLTLHSASIWLNDDEAYIGLDYFTDPEQMNYLLTVVYDLDGTFDYVSLES